MKRSRAIPLRRIVGFAVALVLPLASVVGNAPSDVVGSRDAAVAADARHEVRSYPSFVAQPVSQQLLVGDPFRVEFAYSTSAIIPPVIRLQKWESGSWQLVEGVQVQTGEHRYTFDRGSASSADSGRYRLESVRVWGSTVNGVSNEFTVSVDPEPRVVTQPAHVTVGEGERADFSAAFATGSLPTTIRWQTAESTASNVWTDVAGATGPSLTVLTATTAMDGRAYRAVATARSSAGSVRVVQSAPARLTVVAAAIPEAPAQSDPWFIEHPADVTVVSTAREAEFSVRIGVPDGIDRGNVVVTWNISPPGSSTWYMTGPWQNISADGYATYRLPLSSTSDGYRVRAILAARPAITVQWVSEVATLTIVPLAPVITEHPRDVSVFEGFPAEFSSTADGQGVATQWQVSRDSGQTWTDVDDATGASLRIEAASAAMNGWQYRAVHTNVGGVSITHPARLTVRSGPPRASVGVTPVVRMVDRLPPKG